VHLVYRYTGECQRGAYKGLKIEIQIRSRLQHAWATALEIIDTFTGQGLKSAGGKDDWKRFFALMGTAMALTEKRPIVPDTPSERPALEGELIFLCEKLNIPNVFMGLSTGIDIAPAVKPRKGERPDIKPEAYLLTLDSEKKTTYVIGFDNNKEAEQRLLQSEKENIDKPHIQSVMAKADSIQALRNAYPNYYADTASFVKAVRRVIGNPKTEPIPESPPNTDGTQKPAPRDPP
jgi:hypothetical protein